MPIFVSYRLVYMCDGLELVSHDSPVYVHLPVFEVANQPTSVSSQTSVSRDKTGYGRSIRVAVRSCKDEGRSLGPGFMGPLLGCWCRTPVNLMRCPYPK